MKYVSLNVRQLTINQSYSIKLHSPCTNNRIVSLVAYETIILFCSDKLTCCQILLDGWSRDIILILPTFLNCVLTNLKNSGIDSSNQANWQSNQFWPVWSAMMPKLIHFVIGILYKRFFLSHTVCWKTCPPNIANMLSIKKNQKACYWYQLQRTFW